MRHDTRGLVVLAVVALALQPALSFAQGRPDHAGETGPPAHAGESGPPSHSNGNDNGNGNGNGNGNSSSGGRGNGGGPVTDSVAVPGTGGGAQGSPGTPGGTAGGGENLGGGIGISLPSTPSAGGAVQPPAAPPADTNTGRSASPRAAVGQPAPETLSADAALDAVRSGNALPLDAIAAEVRRQTGAEMIDARLLRVGTVLVYAVRTLSPGGTVRTEYYYSRSGLKVE